MTAEQRKERARKAGVACRTAYGHDYYRELANKRWSQKKKRVKKSK